MNNLLLLTKINILSIFNKNSNNKKKNMGFILFLVAFIYLAFVIYGFAKLLMQGYVVLNAPYLLLAQFMLVTTIMILFTNIYKVGGTLFNFKDYDLLMSMPIKRSTVILSKLIMLYIMSFVYCIIFMVPSLIVYVRYVNVNAMFYIVYFLTLFIIPIVPLIISSIIGTIITGVSSRFNKKNIVNYIFTILLFIGAMYLSFSMENTTAIDMANIGKSMVNIFNNIYPLTNMYVNIINYIDIPSLIVFLVIPLALCYLFIMYLNDYYIKINNNLNSYKKKKDYKLVRLNKNSPLIALYKKEIRRYFSSVNYVMNTGIGTLMLTLSVVGVVILGGDKIDLLLGIPEFSKALYSLGPIIIGSFCMLNCSTHSSISLEGKNLWIIKSIPVSAKEIFLSKIMVNLTILIPTILINSTIFNIYFKPKLIIALLMYITPLISSLFISILGIIINMHFPIFDWKNEIKVIKQSLSSFLSLFIGMIIALIPFLINYNMSDTAYIFLITGIMLIITIISYYYMNTKCIKLFNKLN